MTSTRTTRVLAATAALATSLLVAGCSGSSSGGASMSAGGGSAASSSPAGKPQPSMGELYSKVRTSSLAAKSGHLVGEVTDGGHRHTQGVGDLGGVPVVHLAQHVCRGRPRRQRGPRLGHGCPLGQLVRWRLLGRHGVHEVTAHPTRGKARLLQLLPLSDRASHRAEGDLVTGDRVAQGDHREPLGLGPPVEHEGAGVLVHRSVAHRRELSVTLAS